MNPPPPRRTGHDGFRSSGSSCSRCRTRRHRLHNICSSSPTWLESPLFEECTVLKVGTPTRIERVSVRPDLNVPADRHCGGPCQPQLERPTVTRVLCVHGKLPRLRPDLLPIPFGNPARVFVRVPIRRPVPQALEDPVIHFRERSLGGHMPVIVGPTPDHEAEVADQWLLCRHFILSKDRANPLQERMHVLLCRSDEQSLPVFAHVLPEEVEALPDMRDLGFLGREPKPALVEEPFDQRTNLVLQQLP